jgi:hypothetical protein
VPEYLDPSRRRLRQADDRVDRRRLAGAVASQETKEVAVLDAQRQVVDGGETAVPLGEVLDANCVDGGERG